MPMLLPSLVFPLAFLLVFLVVFLLKCSRNQLKSTVIELQLGLSYWITSYITRDLVELQDLLIYILRYKHVKER